MTVGKGPQAPEASCRRRARVSEVPSWPHAQRKVALPTVIPRRVNKRRAPEMSTGIVRALGSNLNHVAIIDPEDISMVQVLGKPTRVVDRQTVPATCGAKLQGPLVLMRQASVNCRACRHKTGIVAATAERDQGPSVTKRVEATDPWPEAVSNGLALACRRCGLHPAVDYRVTDEAWERAVPPEDRLSVICIECLVRNNPWAVDHILEMQVATPTMTAHFTGPTIYTFEPRHDDAGRTSERSGG